MNKGDELFGSIFNRGEVIFRQVYHLIPASLCRPPLIFIFAYDLGQYRVTL